MVIFVEPPEFLVGLRLARSGRSLGAFEHYVERTQPEGARSGPGDLDLVADPDSARVDQFVIESYRDAWGWL